MLLAVIISRIKHHTYNLKEGVLVQRILARVG